MFIEISLRYNPLPPPDKKSKKSWSFFFFAFVDEKTINCVRYFVT